jgi:hypothetical protein
MAAQGEQSIKDETVYGIGRYSLKLGPWTQDALGSPVTLNRNDCEVLSHLLLFVASRNVTRTACPDFQTRTVPSG